MLYRFAISELAVNIMAVASSNWAQTMTLVKRIILSYLEQGGSQRSENDKTTRCCAQR